jgi:hypothetical protein
MKILSLYELKGIGGLKYIVVVTLYIILPVIIFLECIKYGVSDRLYMEIFRMTNIVIPVLSPVLVLLILQEYYESPGNELLFLHTRYLVKRVIIYTLLYIVMLIPIYIILSFIYKQFLFELVRMSVVVIFISGMSYLIVTVIRKVSIAIIIVVGYVLYNLLYANGISVFVYYYEQWLDIELWLHLYLPMLVIGVISYVIAEMINNMFRESVYN